MLPSEFAPLLYRQLVKIASPASRNSGEQMLALAGLMERIFFEATKQEQIAFSTLFARISYAGHKFHIEAQTLRRIHQFRLAVKWVRNGSPATEQGVQLGLRAVAETVLVLTGIAIPSELLEHLGDASQTADNEIKGTELTFAASVRVVALEDHPEQQYLLASDEDDTGRMVRVLYGLPDRNENFMPSIQVIRKVFGFPVTLRLLEVDVDAAGHYRPRAFVVEPDYLVDVSSISECFKDTGPDPYSYLVKKFLPYESTEPILLGNIANFFLDRLLNNPAAEWQTVFRDTFQLYPFVYAPMNDAEVKTVARKAQKHFVNLKNMAASGLAKEGIEPEHCFLEPSFYSEQFGIQGRLDLFYRTENKAAIVELKSGTPFKPNSYGIQRSHFTQTLLYDLLVRSVYGRNLDPAKYILYSGVDLNHLRFAPTVAPEQWEALQLRNQLLALERLLAKIQPGDVYVPALGRLRASQGKGFTERDYGRFESAYGGLNDLEKKYFNAFTGFIAREHWLSKAGEEGTEGSNGHAALWRSTFEEKQQTFSILSHLEILENHADQAEPCITFKKTNQTNPLANFRVGDIAVLHPALETNDTVLQHQVMKCTLTELGKEHVTVQLRFQQHNLKPFETEGFWCLEPDLMDSGFAAMYRGLLEWAEAGKEKRALLLGMVGPFNPTPDPSPDGRGDTPPKAFSDNFGKDSSVQVNPSPDPSPDGRGDVAYTETPSILSNAKGCSVQSTEHPTSPLPSGEGSGVGLTEHPPPKTGSFGQPEETATLERWRYLKNFARIHRKFPTEAEKSLWHELRDKKFHGIKFRRQHAIDEFIADFVSLELRLVIEVDGDIHALQSGYDEQRTEFLNWFGFAVVRFSNDEVLNDMSGVLKTLKLEVDNRKGQLEEEVGPFNPSPDPSPDGRGDTPPKAFSDNFGKGSSVQVNPTPDPSPDGRGDTPPKAFRDNFGKDCSVQSTEHPTSPLPSGEGSGVGLTEHPSPKTGSFGQPEETATLERWRYLKNFARIHRKFPTEAEKSLWHELRDKKFHGIKFRRQHAIDEFIADFVSLELRLVIEVDGDIHALQSGYDEQRTEFLNWFGFAVVRFSNDEVLNDMSGVLKTLKLEVDNRKGQLEEEVGPFNPTPDPSPDGGGTPPKAFSDNLGKDSSVQVNPTPDPSPDGRGDTLPKAFRDNFDEGSSVQFNPTPDPSPDGRGDAPPKAFRDNFGKDSSVQVNPTPDPSPDGRGDVAYTETPSILSNAKGCSVQSTEHPTAPLPSGEGSGVGFPRITQSKDYFLLWGPPGTGKTSVVLRDLAAWVLNQTADNLLLLAYTNRAVDEICEALDSIGGDIRSQYLRIGAKFSTAERFRPQLLNTKIAGAANRADLRAVLDSHRIFVSTVASFSQNEGLLKLKKFQRLIVDEASQILEPQLIGLLTRFEHFILIGDHRQLPAVTTQRPETTTVHDNDLNGIGLCDLRDSYFERLYRRCMDQGWHWAYGQLDRQGRMHTEIMDFPNRHFYEGKLKTLSPEASHYQQLPLNYTTPIADAALEESLVEKRVVFLGIPSEENLANPKISRAEAELTARVVLLFKQLWSANGKEWHPAKTLGIITPWRAQIAQLRASLAAAGLDPDEITIDTVERYQGGAREIIIVSTCVHSEYQLASLVNLSGEGVDRKMNVALTRAREHLILIGNEEILRKDERYSAFIEQYRLEIGK